ncbi:FCD domain-containing protein [Streptomyces javensis]|uniref:GntR C-terminal domain-containing protein n=2 Tax=Streptomyces javensis TaxID=114698 RepID=A0ABN1WH34_9ACTN
MRVAPRPTSSTSVTCHEVWCRGLATFAPQQGFRVVTVSPERLEELTEARVFIETHLVRESVTTGTIEWESDLLAAHHHLARSPFAGDAGEINEGWLNAHARFHRVLLEGCPNRRLRGIATHLLLNDYGRHEEEEESEQRRGPSSVRGPGPERGSPAHWPADQVFENGMRLIRAAEAGQT